MHWNWRHDCKQNALDYDEACFNIVSSADVELQIHAQSSECHECDLRPWQVLPPKGFISISMNTVYGKVFEVNVGDTSHCKEQFRFEQHGNYGWNISNDMQCSPIFTISPPDNPNTPLYALFIIFTLLMVCYYVTRKCRITDRFRWRCNNKYKTLSDMESGIPETKVPLDLQPNVQCQPQLRNRIHSLDTFRGLIMTLMIFVNTGGGEYWFFKHSVWNGVTLADFVFPWFAWVMGFSMAMALRTQLSRGVPRWQILCRCLRRATLLFIVGLVHNAAMDNNLRHIRVLGVLQRHAIAYAVIAVIEALLAKRPQSQYCRRTLFQDLLENWPQWLAVSLVVSLHIFITFFLPVPNCPAGYLGPGGLHNHSQQSLCTGGAAAYVDMSILPRSHYSFHLLGVSDIYAASEPYDPQALLGALTTAFLVYCGVHAGRILLCYQSARERVVRWLTWSVVMGIAAGSLCNWSKEGGLIPLNKKLTSLSYVLLAGSTALSLHSALYLIVDHARWWSGSVFRATGMNALLLFVAHMVLEKTFPWHWNPFNTSSHAECLFMNVWATLLWIMIAVALERHSLFVTV